MTRLVARPHRTARPSTVHPGAWEVGAGAAPTLNPGELTGWDFATDVTVTRRLEVDRTSVLSDCGLPGSADLAMVTLWHAQGTGLMGTSAPIAVIGDSPLVVVTELRGEELGGALVLRSRLVLAEQLEVDDTLTPHRKGSILWESDPHRVVLEGGLARFPISAIPFSDHPHLANGALWALDWSPDDLDRPALGALCLYINISHPRHEALTAEGALTDLVDALRVDITRTILDGVLDDSDFDHRAQTDGETLGGVVGRLFDVVFPGYSTHEVREIRRARRTFFDSTIQAVIGIGS